MLDLCHETGDQRVAAVFGEFQYDGRVHHVSEAEHPFQSAPRQLTSRVDVVGVRHLLSAGQCNQGRLR